MDHQPLQHHPSPGTSPRNSRDSLKRSTPRGGNPQLAQLIEQDAPLHTNSLLVLMYGSFQAAMEPQAKQGVGSWLKEHIQKYGLPSLVRFGSRHRAQVFCREQFQALFEPLVAEGSS
jgi:hypothetical protein